MIKRLDADLNQRPVRRGLQHVSEIAERLIRMYQLQAEQAEMRERLSRCPERELVGASSIPVQSTFGWD